MDKYRSNGGANGDDESRSRLNHNQGPHARIGDHADKSMTTTPDLSDLIADLKHDITTTTIKMRAKFQQQETLVHETRALIQQTRMFPKFELSPFPT